MTARQHIRSLAQAMERQAVALMRTAQELQEELAASEVEPANDAIVPVAVPQVTEASAIKYLASVGYVATAPAKKRGR
jgi:hypothetical protein